jgi:hypothetical protein
MDPGRPQRVRKARVVWEASITPPKSVSQSALQRASQPASQRASQPAPQPASERASQPVSQPASQPAPQPAPQPASQPASQLRLLEPQSIDDETLPEYKPIFSIEEFQGRPRLMNLSPIEYFKSYIDSEVIRQAVTATNSYAIRHETAQPWHPTTPGELYRYLGIWVYMIRYPVIQRMEIWSEIHRLGRYISFNRFNQLHRFFSFRDETISPQKTTECFMWKLKPVITILRTNYMRN